MFSAYGNVRSIAIDCIDQRVEAEDWHAIDWSRVTCYMSPTIDQVFTSPSSWFLYREAQSRLGSPEEISLLVAVAATAPNRKGARVLSRHLCPDLERRGKRSRRGMGNNQGRVGKPESFQSYLICPWISCMRSPFRITPSPTAGYMLTPSTFADILSRPSDGSTANVVGQQGLS